MRAWTFNSRGAVTDVLKLRHDLPQPEASNLSADEVIVKVSHVSLFEPIARLMSIFPHFNNDPWIPNFEFSGTITAVGGNEDKTEKLTKGAAVFGRFSPKQYSKYNGVLAEYIVAPKECLMVKPPNAKLEEVAGLSGAGCTVIGFAELAGLLEVDETAEGPKIRSTGAGKRVLVTGGSTATGLLMLQLAKYLVGDTGDIVTTASARNREAVSQLGADHVIDYNEHPDLSSYLSEHYSAKQFDVIIDFSGTDNFLYSKSPTYLKPDGCFAFAGSMSVTHSSPGTGIISNATWFLRMIGLVISWQLIPRQPVLLGGVPRRSFFHSGRPTPRNMQLACQLVEDGRMRCIVDSVWDMEDVLQAHEHLLTGRIRGKVIVNVSG